jgi:phospholipid/cholesterol/gamma-HCH transport system substrate-binding protein
VSTTAVAGAAGARAGQPAAGRPRFSLEALRASRRARTLAGALLLAVGATIVWLILEAFTGQFTSAVRIRAELPPGSSAVTVDAPVEYLNVTVGKVISEGEAPDGNVAVVAEIYPQNLADIPAGVTAQVAPLSIFGNQYVNLVPPPVIGSAHLVAADFVGPAVGLPSSSLQGTVTQLYHLLNAVHPAQLDTALTAFATALQDNGQKLGQTLTGAQSYLSQAVVPNLGTVRSDLGLLVPAAATLQQAAPSVLATLANASVTGQTITAEEQQLSTLLSSGSASTGTLSSVLQQLQAQLPGLLNESGPLLADVTQSPTELSQTLSGLTTFAAAVASQEQQGPFLSVSVNLPVADISSGVNAALGYDNPASALQALGPLANPPTYTAANCPQYPGEPNPYCGVGGSPDAQPAATGVAATDLTTASAPTAGAPTPSAAAPSAAANRAGAGGTASAAATAASPLAALLSATDADPSAAQVAAAEQVATALNGGRPVPVPGVATMVLLPLMQSLMGSA